MSDTVYIVMEQAHEQLETVVHQAFRGRGGEHIGWAALETELIQRVASASTKLVVLSSEQYDPSVHSPAFYFIPVPNGNDFPAPILLGLIPNSTLEKLKAGKTSVLISMSLEYWTIHNVITDVFLSIQSIKTQLDSMGLTESRVLLMTLSKLPEDILEEVESMSNYRVMSKFSPLIIEWVRHGISDNNIKLQTLKEAINPNKPKLFLNLNNSPRLNRTIFVNVASMLGVLDMGLVSYVPPDGIPPLNSGIRYTIADDLVKSATLEDSHRLPEHLNSDRRIAHRLKLDYDIHNVPNCQKTAGLNWVMNIAHYTATLFSVVTETYSRTGVNDGVDNPMITEKVFKAIAMRHPFMLVGERYSLRLLKSLGFLTYEELFDESYDDMENLIDRAVVVCRNIRDIHYNRDVFSKRLKSVAWKIEHNYRHLMSMNVGDVIANTMLIWEEELRAKAT